MYSWKSDRLFNEFLLYTEPTITFQYEGLDNKIPTANSMRKYKIVNVKYIPLRSDIETLLRKIGEFGTAGEHKGKDYTKQGGFQYETEVIAIEL